MQSGKSSSEQPMEAAVTPARKRGGRWFYPTLYWKNVKRFWPVWSVYLIIWLFLMPLNILTSAHYSASGEWPSSYVLGLVQDGIVLAVLFGLFSAMAVFSYLYNAKSAGMLHALPVRRDGLFLTNWLSGLSFLVLPHALILLLTLGVELLVGRVALWPLILWFLCLSLSCLFFYSFAVFCAMFTGNLVALPVFYGILNFLAAGLAYLFETVARQFLFGFTGAQGLHKAALWLTPSLKLYGEVYSMYGQSGGAGPLHGFIYILFYAVVGAVLSVLALLVYRRRHLETAGDIVSVFWVRPVFKYGVASCCAIVFGVYLYSFLFGSFPDSAWGLLSFMLLCGLIGYFVAEMLLRKSFRIFRRSWKGGGCFALALVLCCCALEFDVTGFERRVPDPAAVRTVTVSRISSTPYDSGAYAGLFLTDPEDVAALTALHAAIVREKGALERPSNDYRFETSEELEGITVAIRNFVELRVEYELTDGGFLTRQYALPVTDALLSDPNSPASRLNTLLNRPDLVEGGYFRNLPEDAELVRASVNLYDAQENAFTDSTASNVDLSGLLAAVRSDMAAGRLGRRYLLDNEERYRNCYYNDLTLTFYYTYRRSDGTQNSNSMDIVITLQATAADTLRELERLGLVDEEHPLLTHMEMQQWENAANGQAALVPDKEVSADQVIYSRYNS